MLPDPRVFLETAMRPSSILVCWELGGGLGHLAKCALLASKLLARGCEVSFAVRDLASAHRLLPETHYCLVQAPVSSVTLQGWPPPADYAEILLHSGWGQRSELESRVRGWRGLFDALNVDLVIAEHAPTAILAARTEGIPAVAWGSGFFSPPASWPVFRTWDKADPSRRSKSHQLVLETINAALASLGCLPIPDLDALFLGVANFLCTWPELDHYPQRDGANYCGPVWLNDVGIAPAWPDTNRSEQKKIFAYLRPNLPGVESILQALANQRASTLVYMTEHARFSSQFSSYHNMRFTDEIVQLDKVSQEADVVISSGSDTQHAMALQGVPTLGLPMNAEQRIASERLATLGCGLYVIPRDSDLSLLNDISVTLKQLLEEAAFTKNAKNLQRRRAEHDTHAMVDRVAEECVRLSVRNHPPLPQP